MRSQGSSEETSDKSGVAELINALRPTRSSWAFYLEVMALVKKIVGEKLPSQCHIAEFGSVPLRTNLPDSELDLTILCGDEVFEKDCYKVVQEALEQAPEARNVRIVEIQQAKVVKCQVRGMRVCLCFNHISGLRKLRFLEEMDRFIKKDSVLKKSLLLIKAWCRYEASILDAEIGLSSHALDVMVLYVFNVHHRDLTHMTPLEVLHKFLSLFSRFDLHRCCLTLTGRVHLIPGYCPEMPDFDENMLLPLHSISNYNCLTETKKPFHTAMNVMEPLNPSENLCSNIADAGNIKNAFMRGKVWLKSIMKTGNREEFDQFFVKTWSMVQVKPHEENLLSVEANRSGCELAV
ncbi:hypothetical protein BSKO_12715 [Bryopsis sp. KO-2023]|nr:hypothetical protein BSKO_12715 [Bryopsis sp. KO-2023]